MNEFDLEIYAFFLITQIICKLIIELKTLKRSKFSLVGGDFCRLWLFKVMVWQLSIPIPVTYQKTGKRSILVEVWEFLTILHVDAV